MDETPNLNLPYILPSQAQKHVTHNEALRALDALVQLTVITHNFTAPPAAPSEGDRYLIAAGATGAWSGHAQNVALFIDGGWLYYVALPGWLAFVQSENSMAIFNGTAWEPMVTATDLNPVDMVGINTTADITNRLAVSSSASLFNHAGAGHQVKVNKNGASDTASLLFQSNWTGHAEMGLAGSKDFSIKVGSDSGQWYESLRVDRATGNVMIGAMSPTTKLHVDGPIRSGSSNIASLPSASSHGAGSIIFVTNAADGAQHAYSDGTSWRSLRTGSMIS